MNTTRLQTDLINSPSAFPSPSGSKSVRAIGWVLMLVGPCLSLAMLCAAGTLFDTIHHLARPVSPTHWQGGPEFTGLSYALFDAVFLLGITIFTGGVYQARTGRRHPVIVGIVLLLAAVTAGCVYSIISTPSASL